MKWFPRSRSLGILCVVGALLACKKTPDPVSLDPVPGAPLQIVNITAEEAIALGLSSGKTETVRGTDENNSLRFGYEAKLTSAMPPDGTLAQRVVCRVGDYTIGEVLGHVSGIVDGKSVGESAPGGGGLSPSHFVNRIPSACEMTFVFKGLQTKAIKPVELGRVCYHGGKLHRGACPAAELPRTKPPADFVVPELVAEVTSSKKGGFDVGVFYLVTVGKKPHDQARVAADVRCQEGGSVAIGRRDDSVMHHEVGESADVGGHAFRQKPLGSKPTACEIAIRHVVWETGGLGSTIDTWCLKGEKAVRGVCRPTIPVPSEADGGS